MDDEVQGGGVGAAIGGLFSTLINGISVGVDNAVTELIGGDDVVRTTDQAGDSVPAGTAARDTITDVLTNPVALIGLGIVAVLLVILARS